MVPNLTLRGNVPMGENNIINSRRIFARKKLWERERERSFELRLNADQFNEQRADDFGHRDSMKLFFSRLRMLSTFIFGRDK